MTVALPATVMDSAWYFLGMAIVWTIGLGFLADLLTRSRMLFALKGVLFLPYAYGILKRSDTLSVVMQFAVALSLISVFAFSVVSIRRAVIWIRTWEPKR